MRSENSRPRKENGVAPTRITAKFSVVLIGTGSGLQVFPSVASVPRPLREKLQQTTQGANSATILIADKRGREELVRALERQPQAPGSAAPPAPQPRSRRRQTFCWRTWAELLLPIGAGISLWLYFSSRF